MRFGGVLPVSLILVLITAGPLAAQEESEGERDQAPSVSVQQPESASDQPVQSPPEQPVRPSARQMIQEMGPLVAQATPAAAAPRRDALELYRQGRFQDAINVCLQEIQEQPRRMDAYAVLGWSLLRLSRYNEVLTYGKRALSISRYDIRIIEQVGEAYYHLGNNLEALKHFEEYVAYAPNGSLLSDVYYFMGEIFIRMEEYRHAEIAYTAALNYNPRVAIWWSRLGYVRETIDQPAFAIEAYDRALRINPRLGDAQQGRQRMQQKLANG